MLMDHIRFYNILRVGQHNHARPAFASESTSPALGVLILAITIKSVAIDEGNVFPNRTAKPLN